MEDMLKYCHFKAAQISKSLKSGAGPPPPGPPGWDPNQQSDLEKVTNLAQPLCLVF